MDEIHSTTLELLADTGVKVTNSEGKKILVEAGCIVSQDIVKIPESLVIESLRSVPSSFSIFTRNGKESFSVGGDDVLINPGSSAAFFKDRHTGEIRKGTSSDILDLVKIVEQLEYIKVQSTALIASDVAVSIAGLHRLYIILKTSVKPIVTGAFSKDDFIYMRKMLEYVSGGAKELVKKPQAVFDCCPTSPLVWGDIGCQNLIDCAKAGIPAQIVPAPLMGVSSPVTIMGTLVQQNMEILSGFVISHLVNPKEFLVYGGAIGSLDMRFGTPRFSSIEAIMAAIMSNEMGKFYNVPTHAYLGTTESIIEDSQSGYETGLGLIMGILARVNVISGPGLLAQLNCQSLEKLVIDNELCGSAFRLMRDSDSLVDSEIHDLISFVGPGGDYLTKKHTQKNYRDRHIIPSDILSRINIQSWISEGRKTTYDRAKLVVDKLLEKDATHCLPISIEEELDKVYGKAMTALT
jgi:trimethylamine--corrinoid protein Co-methyltransferase